MWAERESRQKRIVSWSKSWQRRRVALRLLSAIALIVEPWAVRRNTAAASSFAVAYVFSRQEITHPNCFSGVSSVRVVESIGTNLLARREPSTW
jgi:hypothetical protein